MSIEKLDNSAAGDSERMPIKDAIEKLKQELAQMNGPSLDVDKLVFHTSTVAEQNPSRSEDHTECIVVDVPRSVGGLVTTHFIFKYNIFWKKGDPDA